MYLEVVYIFFIHYLYLGLVFFFEIKNKNYVAYASDYAIYAISY